MSGSGAYARSPVHTDKGDKLSDEELRSRKKYDSSKNGKPNIFERLSKDSDSKVKMEYDFKKSTVFRHLVPEIITGYCFWTLFHALAPMIWFYPLNELEISGYELFALCFLSPILLSLPGFTHLLTTNRYFTLLLRIGSLVGLYSFQSPTTLTRLVLLALGVSCVILLYVRNLYARNNLQRSVCMWALILSHLLLLSSRIWFVSLTPAWSDYFTNTIIISVVIIATIDRHFCEYDSDFNIRDVSSETGDDRSSSKAVLVGVALGSYHYINHALLGEVSLLSRWTVKGYPSTGPQPNPYGYLVYLSVCIGYMLGTNTSWAHATLWYLFGLSTSLGFYLLSRWSGYTCGLLLCIYISSLSISLHDQCMRKSPAITLTTAFAIYVAEVLFSVWCTAYNFVPGGVYTREHTDWLLIFIILSIALSLFFVRRSPGIKIHNVFDNPTFARVYIGLCFTVCLTLATGGFIYRIHHTKYQHPTKIFPKQISAGIWTYHFGYDNKGWPSLERAAQLINDTEVDVITLLESDASKPYLGNNDLGSWLGERLGMYVDFGPSTRDHTWGNLLLSKYPIIKSTHHLLPSPHGELAPAISALVDFSGTPVLFITTHMGNDRDSLDRQLQADYLAEIARKSSHPVIFLGYVTSSPGSRDYVKLTEHGNLKDIDSTDHDRWCEYIMYRGLIRLGYARISHGGLSDTELQIAKFQIPKDAQNFQDNSQIVKDVAEEERFSPSFGPHKNGQGSSKVHEYHMSSPKYFRRTHSSKKPSAST